MSSHLHIKILQKIPFWRKIFLLFCIGSQLFSENGEESLFLRRIRILLSDQNASFSLLSDQVEEFLHRHPKSSWKSELVTELAERALARKDWGVALSHYLLIEREEWQKKNFLHLLTALYEGNYWEILKEKSSSFFSQFSDHSFPLFKESSLHSRAIYPAEMGNRWIQTYHPSYEELIQIYFFYAESHYHEEENNIQRREGLIPLYQQLCQTSYRSIALQRLASLYSETNHLLELAQISLIQSHECRNREEAEIYLLRRALILAQYNHTEAAEELTPFFKRFQEADLSLFYLWTESEQWNQLYTHREFFAQRFSDGTFPLPFSLFLGLSGYFAEDFSFARQQLELSLKREPLTAEQKKRAIQVLLQISLEEAKESEVLSWAHSLLQIDGSSGDSLQTLHTCALFHWKFSEEEKALHYFRLLLSHELFSQFPQREEAFWQYIQLLYAKEEWEHVQRTLFLFLRSYPNSPHVEQAISLFLYAYRQVPHSYYLSCLLKQVMIDPSQMITHWKELCTLALSSTLYREQNYEEAISLLEERLSDSLSLQQTEIFYYFLTLTHLQAGHWERSLFFGEQLVSLSPEGVKNSFPHLHATLFSLYIQKLQNHSSIPIDQRQLSLKRALDHLSLAWKENNPLIERRELSWFLHYSFHNLEQIYRQEKLQGILNPSAALSGKIEQILHLYEEFFQREPARPKEEDEREDWFIHQLQLGKIYKWKDDRKREIALLEEIREELSLSSLYCAHCLQLIEAYRALHCFDRALTLCTDHLSSPSAHSDLFFFRRLQLEKARTLLELAIKREQFEEEFEEGLHLLETLYLKKSLQEEPVHLEAALDYLHYRSLLTLPRERMQFSLNLLQSIQEHFVRQGDIPSCDYHYLRSQSEKKNRLYSLYLLWMDLKREQLLFSLEQEKGNLASALERREIVQKFLKQLQAESDQLTDSLVWHTEKLCKECSTQISYWKK